MSEIPGADVLGFGFNILGSYDISSVTQQIFEHQTLTATTYTYQPTGITYNVPDNTSVVPHTTSTGSGQVFNTQEQFQTYFSTKAGVKGSYGGFSGQFNAAYSQTLNTNNSYSYGLYEADFTGWKLILTSHDSSLLSDGFTGDPDVALLPTTFTPESRERFFAVFRKFGTHIITQVTVGGSFNYYLAVASSYSGTEREVQANISLEYKAVFASGSAESQTEWKQLGKEWADSRIVKVSAVGGSASVLNALDPSFGDSDASIFKTWSTSVMQNPAAIDFQVTPLYLLFDGDRAAAVQQALEAYTNGAILAYGNADLTPHKGPGGGWFTTSSGINVSGTVIQPDPPVSPPAPITRGTSVFPIGGYQIALLDPVTLAPIMSHIYYQDQSEWLTSEARIYAQMMADINKVTQQDYVAVVASFAINLLNYPATAFAEWLSTIGAGLSGWKGYLDYTDSAGIASYVCIGKRGLLPGNAVEAFVADENWIAFGRAQTTDASAIVLLYANPGLSRTGARAFGSTAPGQLVPA